MYNINVYKYTVNHIYIPMPLLSPCGEGHVKMVLQITVDPVLCWHT